MGKTRHWHIESSIESSMHMDDLCRGPVKNVSDVVQHMIVWILHHENKQGFVPQKFMGLDSRVVCSASNTTPGS